MQIESSVGAESKNSHHIKEFLNTFLWLFVLVVLCVFFSGRGFLSPSLYNEMIIFEGNKKLQS